MALFGKKKEKAGSALKTYEKVANDGFQAMKSGNEEKAILSFRKLLRWVTEDADKISRFSRDDKLKLSKVLTDAGESMIRMKEYDSAIKLLEKAKTVDPKNFRAWMDIGRDLIQRNTQIPYALVCLREAAKLKPNNVEVHLLLGDAYRTQGQDEKATKEYGEVLRIDPENEDAIEKMLKLQPENVDLMEKYINILEKKGNKEDLIKAYTKMTAITGDEGYIEKGLKIDPENKDLLMHKVRILINSGDMDEARQIVNGLIQKYPNDPDVEMLSEELKPEEAAPEEEEVKPIGVEEVFGDIGFEEMSLEEEQPEELSLKSSSPAEEVKIEQSKESMKEIPSEEVKEEIPEVAPPTEIVERETAPVKEVMEELPKPEEEKPEMAAEASMEVEKVEEIPKKEEIKVPETTPSAEEVKAEVVMKEKIEQPKAEEVQEKPLEIQIVQEEKEISPLDRFKKEIESGNKDTAKEIMRELSEEEIRTFLNENESTVKLILDILEESQRYNLAMEFATKLADINNSDENLLRKSRILIELGRVDEAEKELNELLKRNMKNGYALYEKAKIMAIRGNEMGARNFLMMATRFTPELKSKLKDEKYFEKVRDKEWFKKMQA